MAKVIGGITTSHIPAVGNAINNNLQQNPTGSVFLTATVPPMSG